MLFPFRQSDFYASANLKALFESGIIKSAAVGLDGVRPKEFGQNLDQETAIIQRKVEDQTYRFTPFKERLILRGADRPPRQISIPTVRDRLTLRATCNALTSLASAAVPAPPHAHIKKIVRTIRTGHENLSFVRIDVQDFYPSLRHDYLLKSVQELGAQSFMVSLIEKAISTPTGSKNAAKKKGVPQGLSISNILSSIYMSKYDSSHDDNFCRYVDDVMIIAPSHKATDILKREAVKLQDLGLEIHLPDTGEKTKIALLNEGIDYLGYRITPRRVSVRPSSYRKMFSNILRVCTNYKYKSDIGRFIFRLNLKITGCIIDGKRRGWLLFFSQTEDISQLKNLDRFVTGQLNRLGVLERQNEVKRFVKAYHEIRFNAKDTAYIPNFDEITNRRRIEILSILTGKPLSEFDGLGDEELDQLFKRSISIEVQELEKDVIDAIS